MLIFDNAGYRIDGTMPVRHVSTRLPAGKVTGLLGRNGAGKTTLMKLAAGLLAPYQGRVLLTDKSVSDLTPARRARQIGYLPQFQDVAWPMSVAELVALGRLPHQGPLSMLSADDKDAVMKAMQLCGVADFATRPVWSLSGGEQAGVMLARLLATGADILLIDEPVQSLDPARQIEVMQVLKEQAESGKTVLVILHDLTLAARFCDEIWLMREGKLSATGTTREVMTRENLAEVFDMDVELGKAAGGAYVIPTRAISPLAH